MIRIEKQFDALGTINTLCITGNDEQKEVLLQAAEAVKQRVQELDGRFSIFRPDSEIFRLNAAAGRKAIRVSADMHHLLKTAEKYSRKTGGRFQAAAGSLSRLWRNALKSGVLPSEEEICRAKSLAVPFFPLFRRPFGSVGLKEKGQELDFGGIAKGYALDEAMKLLRQVGAEEIYLNFGGSIAAAGREQIVGIRNPLQPDGAPFCRLRIKDRCAVTSGIYEQCLLRDEKTYHHIIDPLSGYPADTGIISVTAVGGSAEQLDVLATSVLLCGLPFGGELARKEGVSCIVVTAEGKIWVSPEIKSEVLYQNEA